MKKTFLSLILLASFSNHLLGAEQYKYKDLSEFKTLASFSSVEKFEIYYNKYIQDCLDHGNGGTMGIPCYVGYELWDKELNIYYKKLHSKLNLKEKKLLEESQKTWINNRDLTIKFNSMLLDKEFVHDGTLYALVRAGDADGTITPIIKERALLLKEWNESYGKIFSIDN